MSKNSKSTPPATSRPFQFVTATNPEQFKDKDTMRQVRQTVMHTYLDKAELDPNCNDVRVTRKRVKPSNARHKRSASSLSAINTITSSAGPSRASPSVIPNAPAHSTNLTSDDQSYFDFERQDSYAASSVSSGTSFTQALPIYTNAEASSHAHTAITSPPLGTSSSTEELGQATDLDHLLYGHDEGVLVQKSNKSREQIPYDIAYGHAYGLHLTSPHADPFASMKPLVNEHINVELLKSNCSSVFGSKAMLDAWVPLLCRTPSAFLSSLCLSAPYTDLMANANTWNSQNPRSESRQTMEVLTVVPQLLNQSLADPTQGFNDTNIAAVLQLLAAQISGDYNWMVPYHRKFLKQMVNSRGGLEKLGGGGVIAVTMCQTELETSVMYNERLDPVFLNYARDYIDRSPYTKFPSPEGPLFCRDNDLGMRSILSDRMCGNATRKILIKMYQLTDSCIEISRQEQRGRTRIGPQPLVTTLQLPHSHLKISTLAYDLHELLPASVPGHQGFNDPYYEAVRLTALIYTHAIQHQTPFHRVSEVRCSVDLKIPATCAATPAMIYEQLNKTNVLDCWHRMGGALYWILMIASAASHIPDAEQIESPLGRRDSVHLSRSNPTPSNMTSQDLPLHRSDSAPTMPGSSTDWTSQPETHMPAMDFDFSGFDDQSWSQTVTVAGSDSVIPAQAYAPTLGTQQYQYMDQSRRFLLQHFDSNSHTPFTSATPSLTESSRHTPSPPLIVPMPPHCSFPESAQTSQPQQSPMLNMPSYAIPSQGQLFLASQYHTPAKANHTTTQPPPFKRARTSTAPASATTRAAIPIPSSSTASTNPSMDDKATAFRRKYLFANAVRTSILLRFEHTTAMLHSTLKLGEVTDYLNHRDTPPRKSKERR
ncbi:Hypothetical protein D9617_21g096660 [Elsinoe fawcettii]|nr:Hypothetical protein D9617_21g096660 [Elsinoe fawcettii]